MSIKDKVKDLIAANPRAGSELSKIETAIEAVRQRRAAGMGPKEYELSTPFGNRGWLRQVRAS